MLALSPIPALCCAQVGMFDGTVRVLSLDPDSTLKVLATQVRLGQGVSYTLGQ